MKMFVFKVSGHEFIGSEPFGQAFKDARKKAEEMHAPIYRTKIETTEDVYVDSGMFIGVKYAKDDEIKKF